MSKCLHVVILCGQSGISSFQSLLFHSVDVELRWDYGTSIYVTVHPGYKGTLCGLCGNFNGNSEDDLLMPRGNMVETSVVTFAEAWKVTTSCPATASSEDPCVTNPSRKTWAEYSCALIKQSLFAACHNVVSEY